MLLAYLLSRNIRIEEDLVAQLFNSSERRLAGALLLLARFGKKNQGELIHPKTSQDTLAALIGAERSTVRFLMNKFRQQGFVDYIGG